MTIRWLVCASLLVVFWSTATTAAAASAAPSPSGSVSPSGLVSPSGAASADSSPSAPRPPSLDLPAQAAPGSTFAVVGRDFIVGKPVAIWLAPAGAAGEPTPLVTDADAGGSFSTALTAPATNPSAYLVLACQGCKDLSVAERECAAGVAVGLACSTITITGPSSRSTVQTRTRHGRAVGVRTGHPSVSDSPVGMVVAAGTSWSRFAVPLAAAALLLAAAVVTLVMRRRRRPPHTQGDARLRPMTPPDIEVHDGSSRITVRLACSLPPADVYTEDVPR